MVNGDCINIFMGTQPCHTANGYWGLHQMFFYGYSALSHCKWELGSASISSWLLSPVTLQMGTGDCINIFMAAQPCNTANGYWGLHHFFFFLWPCHTANGHWGLHQIFFLWLLSPVTLQMGTRECINIFMAAQPCNTANGHWGLHQFLHGYLALSHSKWVLGIV